jgi:hypothetical protein
VKAFLPHALGRSQWLLAVCLGSWAAPALAQQRIVIDETYTATAQNTTESHYRIKPLASTPSNWRSPVDYTSGMVRVRAEVLEKPSDKKTLVNICFEGNAKSCMPYPPAYTAPGIYNFSAPFGAFWQFDKLDWTKGIQNVAVVLKTETEVEAQGDPLYYPAKMHVTITLVPPTSADDDAGAAPPRDAGAAPDAGRPDAAVTPPADAGKIDATVAMPAAGAKPTPPAAGTTAPSGGSSGTASATDAGGRDVRRYLSSSDSGCSTLAPRSSHPSALGWFAAHCIGLCVLRRRAHVRRARRKAATPVRD